MDKPMNNYIKLLLMAILSFIAMYVLMYMMANKWVNVYNNLNQLYMAGMMMAPMILIELVLMNAMYPNRVVNTVLISLMVVFLILFIVLIRNQTAISDKEFLKSMIPHHAGAILMCQNAPLQDLEIKKLCDSIISSQQSEIDWMKNKLSALDNNKKD